MSTATTLERTPLVITAGDLVAGPIHTSFREGDPTSLLHNYLVLVRQLRGQQREPSITLRGEDISALAAHLGTSDEEVLGDLLDRMGATRAQRRALFAMFAVGALSMVATGSVALEYVSAESIVGGSDAQVVLVAEGTPAAASVLFSEPAAPAVAEAPYSGADAELAIATGGSAWLTLLAEQLAAVPTAPVDTMSLAVPSGEGVGVADDGSIVAVAPPPVPSMPSGEGVGVADDGSIVAVAPPPVPSVEGVGVADDGSIVAVAPPPVP